MSVPTATPVDEATTHWHYYADGIDLDSVFQEATEDNTHDSFMETDDGCDRWHTTIGGTHMYHVLSDTLLTLEEAVERYPSLLNHEKLADGSRCGALPIGGSDRRVEVPLRAITGGYRDENHAITAALNPVLRPGESIREITEATFYRHADTRTIVSGLVGATLSGGQPTHIGWLFFGLAQNTPPQDTPSSAGE
ncbi:hypothetical protein ETD86_50710 [Nonomuraea turkmeniaca]|uniref:Uncharacterized protein n=1 Tax=Nonomuraea turkmeniaca TaxID=103838 RepID=A0A5S4EVY1_9ACTN|nr:hypothetical protein [Nonomuraea turkmeniaca]TMR07758.1 hypothetical protein ETD86_50710 [Nonomuraea turkmeniaca]